MNVQTVLFFPQLCTGERSSACAWHDIIAMSLSVALLYGLKHHGWVQAPMEWLWTLTKFWKSSAQRHSRSTSMEDLKHSLRAATVMQNIRTKGSFWARQEKNRYYLQAQLQQYCCHKRQCDIVVWSSTEAHIIKLCNDADYLNARITKLEGIYFLHHPEIVCFKSTMYLPEIFSSCLWRPGNFGHGNFRPGNFRKHSLWVASMMWNIRTTGLFWARWEGNRY